MRLEPENVECGRHGAPEPKWVFGRLEMDFGGKPLRSQTLTVPWDCLQRSNATLGLGIRVLLALFPLSSYEFLLGRSSNETFIPYPKEPDS